MNDLLKKLAGKDRYDYEFAASEIINNGNIALFSELIENDGFLFDFVKRNISERLKNAVNEGNYLNLLKFLKFYSPFYADMIAESLAQFANDDLLKKMLELFKTGTISEKSYCAKFFSYIDYQEVLPLLRENAFSEDENLNYNCAEALGILKDKISYDDAVKKLENLEDDFEAMKLVKFLVAYGEKNAVMPIIECMVSSSLQENIAGEIPYLISIFDLLNSFEKAGLLVLNNIINGLGETIELSVVLDFELLDVFRAIISHPINSCIAVVLLNAREKFETLTENNEYTYDEDKNTKAEIEDIKKVLTKQNRENWLKLVKEEVREDSLFVYTALDFCNDEAVIKELLRSNNQTLILRAVEVLKNINCLNNSAKTIALSKVTDINIKNIIRAL